MNKLISYAHFYCSKNRHQSRNIGQSEWKTGPKNPFQLHCQSCATATKVAYPRVTP